MDYRTLTAGQVYGEVEAIRHEAEARFGRLTREQLNWKASPGSWSVAQCLDHLITINREYYPTFERILTGDHPASLLHRLPVLPAMFGRIMVQALSPDSRRRFKAPRTALPSSSALPADIVERFAMHQRELLSNMRALEGHGLADTIITSPFARVIVYSLLDAMRLIVAHERRHLAQARRVMTAPAFPGHDDAGELSGAPRRM